MTGTALLGSTGSVGRQALEVMDCLGARPAALAAFSSITLMEEQARKYRPGLIAIFDEPSARDLRTRIFDTGIKVVSGPEGLIEAALLPEAGTVLAAMSGIQGLRPVMEALGARKRIALANKETLVCAGELVMERARRFGAEIIPVDSEHSAIFQCLAGNHASEVSRIILTASGGPFFGYDRKRLEKVTPGEALVNPNWSMGPKITVDSASLMNKGQEFIEAVRLFSVEPERVDVVVHRQSVIHSMVEFRDGAVIAQMGTPDMRLPIQYALTYPERVPGPAKPLDFDRLAGLTFSRPDYDNFSCLGIAIGAVKRGPASCAALSAADEAAVELFLRSEIGFLKIPELVESAISFCGGYSCESIDDVVEIDRLAREHVLVKA